MRSEKRRIIRRVARRDVGNSTRDVWFARPGEARALWRRTIEPSQSIRSSGRTVLDRADDCSEDGACNAATGRLADDGADIRRRCGIGEQRNQHAEKLAAGAAADRPAMVFPNVPRSMFLAAPAATFPPTAPAMIWIRRLISMPDMTRNSPNPVF